jgi:hypothetical protein
LTKNFGYNNINKQGYILKNNYYIGPFNNYLSPKPLPLEEFFGSSG